MCLCLMGLLPGTAAGARSKKVPITPKWGHFEHTFNSSISYPNPLQTVTLRVVFTSPLGETNEVFGFWDGGKQWRVRFCPWQIGRWTYTSSCSDPANRGLQGRSGEFLCTAPSGPGPFERHGPVRISRDGDRLEHLDGTPFFWVADTAWNGPLLASTQEWDNYAQIRASQQFNVIQWSALGAVTKSQTGFTLKPSLTVHPAYFQALDRKLDTLRRAGLLSAILPFDGETSSLADEQLALLGRYMIARWGTQPVAWLVSPDPTAPSTSAERWRRLGQHLFAPADRAPVILLTDRSPALRQQFRDQSWIDLLACPSLPDNAPLPATTSREASFVAGPLRIASLPTESPSPPSEKLIGPQEIRRAAYWQLCLDGLAGVTYAAPDIAKWNRSVAHRQPRQPADPAWRKSLYLPVAKEISLLAGLVNSVEYWKLQAIPKLVAVQPGEQEPARWISAATTPARDTTLVYVPTEGTLELALDALPPSPNIVWFNPRTGETSPAVAVVGADTYQFPTPESGDWLLVIREAKQP